MKQGYKKWKEETSTSPSRRYLYHVKTLLVPNGNSYDDEDTYYVDDLWKIHTTITNCAIILKQPLTKRLKSTVVMIEKSKGNNKISRLRVNNLYEVDYNLLLKIIVPKKVTHCAEDLNLSSDNYWGTLPKRSSETMTIMNELIIENHRLTNTTFTYLLKRYCCVLRPQYHNSLFNVQQKVRSYTTTLQPSNKRLKKKRNQNFSTRIKKTLFRYRDIPSVQYMIRIGYLRNQLVLYQLTHDESHR